MSCIFKTMFDWFSSSKEDSYENIKNEELKNIILNYKPNNFVPYSHYNKDMDSIEACFIGNSYYVQPLNKNLDIYISQETNEVVGVRINNITRLINE